MKPKHSAPIPGRANIVAGIITDAQTEIKVIIKNAVLYGRSAIETKRKIEEAIKKAVKKLDDATLRRETARALMRFANFAYDNFNQSIRNAVTAALFYAQNKRKALEKTAPAPVPSVSFSRLPEARQNASSEIPINILHGLPNQTYQKKYFDDVRAALDALAATYARAEGDNQPLRTKAELLIRQREHVDEISEFRRNGVRLVVCSVHADCSDRCFKWQGRVYSLDGTSGTTEDGREYVPLETATDVYVTTKKGTRYKNGLLGFGCRHKLYAFTPHMVIPHVDKKTQEREDAINQQQRYLERQVRKFRELAAMYAGVDTVGYKKARAAAVEWRKRYETFSRENKRAFYRERLQVI